MRIVHVCVKSDEIRTLRMAEWCASLGHEVVSISGGVAVDSTTDAYIYRDDYHGVKRFFLNHRFDDNALADELVKMFRPDVVHIHEIQAAHVYMVRWTQKAREAIHIERQSNPRDWIAAGATTRKFPCRVILDHHEYDLHRARDYCHPGDWNDVRDFYTWIAPVLAAETVPTREIGELLGIEVPRLHREVVYNAGPRPPAKPWPDPKAIGCPDRLPGLKRILYSGNISFIGRRLSWLRYAIAERKLSDRWNIGVATTPGQFRASDWPARTQLVTFVPFPTLYRPSPEFYSSQANNDLLYLGGDTRFLTWRNAWPNKFSDAIFAGVPVLSSDMTPVSKVLQDLPSLGRSFRTLDELTALLVEAYEQPFKVDEDERQAFIKRCSYEDASGPAIERAYEAAGVSLRSTKAKAVKSSKKKAK